jgi:hypothetical protein
MFPVRQVCRDRRGFAIAHAGGRRTTGNRHERASDRVTDRVGKLHRSAPQMSKAKNCKILLGMTADVLPLRPKFKHEQIST